MRISPTLAAMAVAATTLAATAFVAPAQAQSSTTTITTDDGRTFTRDVTRSGPANNRSGSVTVTGPDGRTTTRTFQRSYDRQNGFQRQGTITGPNGRTATVRGSARCSGGACERTVQRRGFGGRESIVRGSGRRVAPGVFQGRRSVTGPRGRTRGFNWRRVRR